MAEVHTYMLTRGVCVYCEQCHALRRTFAPADASEPFFFPQAVQHFPACHIAGRTMNISTFPDKGEAIISKTEEDLSGDTSNTAMDPSQIEERQEPAEDEDPPEDEANLSMDMTQVEEESMDTSHGSDDLKVTLEEAMALRQNLASKFEEEQDSRFHPQSSIREKIAHFEGKASQNRSANKADLKKPPATIVTTTSKSHTNDRLKVYLRVRPCASREPSTIEILPNSDGKSMPTTIRTYPPLSSQASKSNRSLLKGNDGKADTQSIKEFEFTTVLGPDVSQYDVFQKTTASLANGLCRGNRVGKSALLFCYGVTGSGKTYTTIGDPQREESMGILPRSLSTVLHKVENTDMGVFLSSFEIYNEHLIDLIPKSGSAHSSFSLHGSSLKIRQGPDGRMIIPGLAEYKVNSVKSGLSLIRRAKEARHSETNRVNLHSSRSHSVCQLTVRRRVTDSEGEVKENYQQPEEAHLWIVDLAGNERTKRTNPGTKSQKEAAHINRSLMSLMRCLTSKTKTYRDSLLTMLFMHHWIDPNNTTTMIVNAHGAASDYDETQHVLSYAISSKSIPVVANQSVVLKQKNDEYDYDGRRKGGKPLTMAQKAAKIIRKLSPKRAMGQRKRKNEALVDGGNDIQKQATEEDRVVKKTRMDTTQASTSVFPQAKPTNQSPIPASREVTSLQMQLAVARAEIQSLESKNRELLQQVETMETSVRAQVSDEMLQEMMDMRRRYEGTIQKLKESFVESDKVSASSKTDKNQSKVQELVEKVEECEEEMARMTRIHRSEIKEMEEDHHNELNKKDQEIAELKQELAKKTMEETDSGKQAELEKQLAASQAEVIKLKRSKEELVKSYEKLLAADEEEEDDDESETDDDEKEEEEIQVAAKRTPKFVKTNQQDQSESSVSPLEKAQESKENVVKPASTVKKNPWQPKVENINEGDISSNTKSDVDQHSRKPLASLSRNKSDDGDESDSDSSFGPSKWLAPRKPTKKDPRTGLFARPKGRMPAAAEAWDSKKGAWRLSMAN